MQRESLCQFVTASSVRVAIVNRLADRRPPIPAPTLVDELGASRSGVYTELSNLEDRGVLTESPDGWQLTTCGQLVADTIAHRQTTETFLARDLEYWQTRQTGVLPEQFRRRLPEIGEYEIVRGEIPAVSKHEDELIARMNTVDHCDIVSVVYLRKYEDAIPDSPETRLLLTPAVIDQLLERVENGTREQLLMKSNPKIRPAPVEFGLNRSPEYLCLVLPHRSKERTSEMLISETEAAIRWGKELFESLWTDAEPLDAYLETRETDDSA